MPDEQQTRELMQILLTEKEMENLVLALARGRAQSKKKQTFSEAEATMVINIARLVRLQHIYLKMALEGHIHVDLDEEGHIVWVWPEESENSEEFSTEEK